MSAACPIGVFDSGIGGISVLREIRRELPAEDLCYVADSSHAPYGEKSATEITARALLITEFLLNWRIKALVVACNTATGAAIRVLRARYAIPIIAVEPAIKPAVAVTRSGVIGVLATRRTLSSQKFARLLEQFSSEVKILLQPCPGLVEQIEVGDFTGVKTRKLLTDLLNPLLTQGADTFVLGCTHYPFVAPLIKEITESKVIILDSGAAVARQVRKRLSDNNLLNLNQNQGYVRFWTTGDPTKSQDLLIKLWSADVKWENLN